MKKTQNKIDLTGYEVKEDGTVISYKGLKPRVLRSCINGGGYLVVGISQGSKSKIVYVHKLVAQEFLDYTPTKGYHIDHIDRDKLNNHVNNLQILTEDEHWKKDNPNLSTGIRGVTPNTKGFKATIYYKGYNVNLGSNSDDAVCDAYYQGAAATILEIE